MKDFVIIKKHTQESPRGTGKYIHNVSILGSCSTRKEAESLLEEKFLRFIDLFDGRIFHKTKNGNQSGIIRTAWDTHTIEYRYMGAHVIDEYCIQEMGAIKK